MNERLQELMLKHGLHKYISEECQHRMEMLYEVVVRECAGVADNTVIGTDKVGKAIKQHFGVE